MAASHPLVLLAGGVVSLALFLSCGSSTSSPTGNGSGAMTVHLVDGPINGFQEINVNIQAVEISSGSSWITLGSPAKTYNLLALTGGVSEFLASGTTLPAGHYSQMRLLLGTGNTVKLADGTVHALDIPSGLQSGIKLIVSFDVAKGTTKDVWIDFDAAHSIQLTGAGASNKYILRPTVWAYDKIVTGSVSGTFTDGSTNAGIAGAMVFAETLDASGHPAVVRSTVTDANGAYALDLLPVGATYYVVSQPKVGTTTVTAYDAKASGALALTTNAAVQNFSASFTAAGSVGSVSGEITPMVTSSESDTVNLAQVLGTQTFIVDTALPAVGSTTETYSFSKVPAGVYSVLGVRTTLNADGTNSSIGSPSSPATVTAGATTSAAIAF